MDSKHSAIRLAPLPTNAGLDHSEETPADIDEPPESNHHNTTLWSIPKLDGSNLYTKAPPAAFMRRESLLTRQLHSENEHSDEEHVKSPIRGMSNVSTWSNPSVTSTAELTSDDGRSAPSPAVSPPLSPTQVRTAVPITDKPLTNEPKIVGLDAIAAQNKDPVELGLGRKRCITFACGNKDKPVSKPPTLPKQTQPATPPKRKIALKFACPFKTEGEHKTTDNLSARPKRPVSPPPAHHQRRMSSNKSDKVHRGSDSTVVTASSPRPLRKSPTTMAAKAKAESATDTAKAIPTPRLYDSDDAGGEATRFHEFGTSEDEPDEWVQESTCHRNRLFVADTLKKENVIRQLGEEVEEEVLEEDEDIDDEVDQDEEGNDGGVLDQDDDDDAEEDDEDDEESDAGFHSDDEHGFAVSDSEDDGSDNEWWTPGGLSTAATSAEHLDVLSSHLKLQRANSNTSSLGSASSGGRAPRIAPRRRPLSHNTKSSAVPIDRPPTPDLPDSTDFVCGTLDEDRPREQAYINRMKELEAKKHRPVPQDIDPTFPTSDPEMDEEDDEDLEDPESSDNEDMFHGSLDEIHGTARRTSPAPRRNSTRPRSPPPPPPPVRHRSPTRAITRAKSPAPKVKHPRRSPPPPATRARSPAPRKLFGQSPRRHRSPAGLAIHMTSPPNTRRTSPTGLSRTPTHHHHHGLAARPSGLTVTASLPKRSGGFLLSRMGGMHHSDVESSDTVAPSHRPQRGGRRRGAVDIVKGLESKKQRRREKLCQKLAAKAAVRGEDRRKVKPGRGCERMREVALELQKYKGGAGHILSC